MLGAKKQSPKTVAEATLQTSAPALVSLLSGSTLRHSHVKNIFQHLSDK